MIFTFVDHVLIINGPKSVKYSSKARKASNDVPSRDPAVLLSHHATPGVAGKELPCPDCRPEKSASEPSEKAILDGK